MSDDTKDRIAKVMARSGIASRRDAEKMILAGRVAVNGAVITSPALDVTSADKVTLDGKPIDAPQPPRLWLYYKPLGLVTSEKDEKGRQTVFDTMPEGMPRVMSVGRLDITSEGLLLLTNDGELKRRLELPETGWLRRYRVRVNGRPNDATFDPLKRGMVIEGEEFLPMDVTLDKQQGANAWLTVGLREGKNREVRRAMTEVGMTVNRLIRLSYGPFRLNEMKPGDVIEVKARVMREQLGGLLEGLVPGTPPREAGAARPERAGRDAAARSTGDDRPRKPRVGGSGPGGPRKEWKPRPEGSGDRPARPPRAAAEGAPRKDWKPRAEGAGGKPARGPRPAAAEGGPRKEWKPRADGSGDRSARGPRPAAADGGRRKEWKPRAEGAGAKPARAPRPATAEGGPRKEWKPRAEGSGDRPARPPRAPAEGAARKEWKPRPDGAAAKPSRGPRPASAGDGPRKEWKPRAEGPGGKPRSFAGAGSRPASGAARKPADGPRKGPGPKK